MEIQLTKSEDMSSDTNAPGTDVFGMKPDTYCMLLHLSQLLNFLGPPLGIIVPIVLWAIAKDKYPQVDQHGKIILNWLISLFVYAIIGGVVAVSGTIFSIFFMFATGVPAPIGMALFAVITFLLGILGIVFPIIGALKANDGIMWKYPLSIPFFK